MSWKFTLDCPNCNTTYYSDMAEGHYCDCGCELIVRREDNGETTMKVDETRIEQGGLMRCCIQTIAELGPNTDYPDGTIIDCKYEKAGNKSLMFLSGVWRWNDAESTVDA